MSLIDTKISGCKNWPEFRQLASQQKTQKDKGDLFERLTQLYLQTATEYQTKFKNVWWLNNKREFPEELRKKLNLPSRDEGIDLICETHDGEFWSVQSKYKTPDRPVTTSELGKFTTLSFVTAKGIKGGLVVHTSTRKIKKSDLIGNCIEVGLQHWLNITQSEWDTILEVCKSNKLKAPEKSKKRDYQIEAIAEAKKHFLSKNKPLGKLLMPCGTGKSLMAYWIARELNAQTVILALPSLALVKQSLKDWTSEYLAEGIMPKWVAVCSDDDVGKLKEADSTVATVYEAGIPVTTDPKEITNFVQEKFDGPKIIFTTYQSSSVLADACREAGLSVDLLIADEAHKTVGRKEKKFATFLFDENLKIRQRMFMTATERVFRQGSDDVVSMNDPSVYGDTFYEMSFKEAVDRGIICDYRIITLMVSEQEAKGLMEEHARVLTELGNQKIETDAHNLGTGVAVSKAFKNFGIKHALTFHSTIKRAENFVAQQDAFGLRGQDGKEIINYNVSSKKTAGERAAILSDFVEDELSLISNARCLTEGVNIPAVDCVVFVDPKKSVVDIVQAAGRAMRQSKETGKQLGYIAIPLVIPDGEKLEDYSKSSNFKDVMRVITSLSTADERIVEQLKNFTEGKPPKPDDIIVIDPEIADTFDVDFQDFYDSIRTNLWVSVGKANWMTYEDASACVQKVGLKTMAEFRAWVKSEDRPADLPTNPEKVYASNGFKAGDFLGTGAIAAREIVFRPFNKGRTFVHSLKLGGQDEWRKYCKSGERPEDIPSNPDSTKQYEKEWKGYGDWLGTGRKQVKQTYRKFEKARKFVRRLKLKSAAEYRKWAATKKRPSDIPYKPNEKYKGKGWNGWGDFLGTGTLASGAIEWMPFAEARAFVHTLELETQDEYFAWAKTDEKPINIPANPRTVYGEEFDSMGDWIGTGTIAPQLKKFKPFEEARKYARNKEFKRSEDWREWAKSDNRPPDIPANPDQAYDGKGWLDWPDFLGKK